MYSDLEDALSNNPEAKKFMDEVAPSYIKIVLYWLKSAKREETRAGRLQSIIDHANKHERVPNLS